MSEYPEDRDDENEDNVDLSVELMALGFDLDKFYYISGPMSGYKNFNYPHFEEIATFLREAGLKVMSPHENPWPIDHETMTEQQLWDHMMKLCSEQMRQCHGIIMLQGWPQSRGAKAELKDAMDVGWPVWFCNEEGVLIGMNRVIKDG